MRKVENSLGHPPGSRSEWNQTVLLQKDGKYFYLSPTSCLSLCLPPSLSVSLSSLSLSCMYSSFSVFLTLLALSLPAFHHLSPPTPITSVHLKLRLPYLKSTLLFEAVSMREGGMTGGKTTREEEKKDRYRSEEEGIR